MIITAQAHASHDYDLQRRNSWFSWVGNHNYHKWRTKSWKIHDSPFLGSWVF